MSEKQLTKEQKKLRKEWCKALRSGKFKQTNSVLYSNTTFENPLGENDFGEAIEEDTFCCLGVLACVLGNPKATTWDPSFDEFRDGGNELLNFETLNKVGLTSDDQADLSKANDEGCDFDQIAAIIEHLP